MLWDCNLVSLHCCTFSPCDTHNLSYLLRFSVHDGEQLRTVLRTEGSARHAPVQRERHTLRHIPVLRSRSRGLQSRAALHLRQGEQQSSGIPGVELVRTGLAEMAAGGTGHQHLLAQFLPGENMFGVLQTDIQKGFSRICMKLFLSSKAAARLIN